MGEGSSDKMDDCEGGEKETRGERKEEMTRETRMIVKEGRKEGGDGTGDKMDDCKRGEKETRGERKEEMARHDRQDG